MNNLYDEVKYYIQLRFEQDKREKENISKYTDEELENLLIKIKPNSIPHPDEPDNIEEIFKLSSFHQTSKNVNDYRDKLEAALIGRFVGCLLGVPVEGYSIEYMEKLAKATNTPFPPTEYWHESDKPEDWIQYGIDLRKNYTLGRMNAFLVDDDINFTAMNLFIMDKYGVNFSTNDVASYWLDFLPIACTAEDEALKELRKGVVSEKVAENNPFIEWIGAAIRADAFGYVYAGNPYKAAKISYNDAILTHRRNGIYGEMFLAASIASAFCSSSPLEAIEDGMNFIPKTSRLYQDLAWAFSIKDRITNFKEARKVIDERFPGMDSVHTINNMCAIVFVLNIAKDDFTKAISNSVALGLDNDCTTATIGSLFGACYGMKVIDPKWYKDLGRDVHLFLRHKKVTTIDELVDVTLKIRNTI